MSQYAIRPASDLTRYSNNSRTHSPAQIDQLAASIDEFGMVGAIVVRNGVIAKGHGTLSAIQQLHANGKQVYPAPGNKQTEFHVEPFPDGCVPVLDVSGWSDDQFRAYVIADNKLALNAGWDEQVLSFELKALDMAGYDLLLTGFDHSELDAIIKSFDVNSQESAVDPDETPEPMPDPITKPGDVWILGNHRLMCGDTTWLAAVDQLMGGVMADMVFTDPPYGVAYAGGKKGQFDKIINDELTGDALTEFLIKCFKSYSYVMKAGSGIYVCHPDSASATKMSFESSFAHFFKKSCTLIWDKGHAGLGYADYRSAHEPILYGWKEGEAHRFYGDKTNITILRLNRDAPISYVHPTQKPVILPETCILNSSKPNDIVADFFGGSGSTLMACEKTGRHCRTMELDPQYADVIIRRWQKYTGKQAVLESNGLTFDFIEQSITKQP